MRTDCKRQEEFLDDSSPIKENHTCESCMVGADCSDFPTLSSLRPKQGYKSLSWNRSIFGACNPPAACNRSSTTGCALGHQNSSELCTQCLPGWAMTARGQPGLCSRCPKEGVMVLIFLITVCAVTLLFTYLVWDNLDGAKDMVPASRRRSGSATQGSGGTSMKTNMPPLVIGHSFM